MLIATDGTLDSEAVAATVGRMYRPGDTVTLMTAILVPTEFLRGLGEVSGVSEVVQIAEAVGPGVLGFASGAKAAERLAPPRPESDRDHVAVVAEFLESTAKKRFQSLDVALAGAGVEDVRHEWRHTDGHTARTVLRVMADLDVDTLIIGSHGYGQFEGLLGSTGTKLIRQSPVNVVVIRRRA